MVYCVDVHTIAKFHLPNMGGGKLACSHGQFPLWGFILLNWSPFVRVNDIPDETEIKGTL